MRVYLDSSVVLRIVLGERGRLASWRKIETGFASELVRVECLRTIDRARVRLGLSDQQVEERRAAVLEVLSGIGLVRLDRRTLERAAEPFPTTLGSLDAIHLATALACRRQMSDLKLATHDAELARAARSEGFSVLGSAP